MSVTSSLRPPQSLDTNSCGMPSVTGYCCPQSLHASIASRSCSPPPHRAHRTMSMRGVRVTLVEAWRPMGARPVCIGWCSIRGEGVLVVELQRGELLLLCQEAVADGEHVELGAHEA